MATNILTTYQKGPSRQDNDLKNRLVNFLHTRHVPGSEAVHLNVRSGTVIVHGPVRSAHAKWLCIECCRHVAGVIKLVDELVIERPPKQRLRRGTQRLGSTKTRIKARVFRP